MSHPTGVVSRRSFLKATTGLSLGGLMGLGFDLTAAAEEARHLKIKGVREVPSVCPYCAVGCGQLVHVNVREKRIVNIEGNPASPISQGTLCPKGAATYQLAVNDQRITRVWYRAPGAREWDKTKTLAWAMQEIAQRVKATRDATFEERKRVRTDQGVEVEKQVNHTLRIATLGGATMDNEWNYVQTKLMRGLGVVFIENQARI
jgi:formate dehydrogenase major subunit